MGGIPRHTDPLIKGFDESEVDANVKLDVRVAIFYPLPSTLAAKSSLCVRVKRTIY